MRYSFCNVNVGNETSHEPVNIFAGQSCPGTGKMHNWHQRKGI